jgi:Flp pilus assembly protein protease CpaA
MGLVALFFVLLATVFDLKSREVPDTISLGLLACAVAAMALGYQGPGWGSMLGGLALGFGLSGIFFVLGGLGGGDVKMITALGAAIGHPAIWTALFWIALAGGGFSLIALIRGRRDLAYFPAIALGLSIHLLWKLQVGHAGL